MSREPLQSAPDTEATASAQAGRGTEPQHPTTIADVGASAGNHALARLLTGPGGGVGLPAAVRTEAETRFGTSFEDVRVHTGDEAEQAAQALSARAFTVGANVYFGRGQYAPDTGSGREVLAHELTHVVQNRVGVASSGGGLEVSDPASESEREAEQAARAYIGGRLVEVPGADNAVVQRLPDEPTTTPVPGQTGNSLVRHLSGTTFTDDAGAVRAQLEDYVVKHGIESLARFESGYELHAADGGAPAGGWPGGLPGPTPAGGDPEYLNRVVTTVRTEIEKLRADAAAFMGVFQSRAIGILIRLLADSERRINEQFTLFGIKPNATTAFGFTLWTSYTGANNDQATLLAADVAALKAKLPAAVDTKAELDLLMESNLDGPDYQVAYDAAKAKHAAAQRAYDIVRNQVEIAHPVLQAYNLDAHRRETASTLDQLASDGDRAAVLGAELTTELGNIEKVRTAIADDPEYVWRIQPVIGSTRELADIQANRNLPDPGLQATVVTDKSARVEAAQELVNIGTTIATIALGLIAATATGGLGLAPAIAAGAAGAATIIDAVVAYNAYQDYQFDSAVAGTDYERAKLLAHDAPELFWLALDVVGAGLSVAGGFAAVRKLFREVVRLRQEVLIARTMQMAAETEPVVESAERALPPTLRSVEQSAPPTLSRTGHFVRPTLEGAADSVPPMSGGAPQSVLPWLNVPDSVPPTLRSAEQAAQPALNRVEHYVPPTLEAAGEAAPPSVRLGGRSVPPAAESAGPGLPSTLSSSGRRVGIKPVPPVGSDRAKLDALRNAAEQLKPGSGDRVLAELESAGAPSTTEFTTLRGIGGPPGAGYHLKFSQAEQDLQWKWAELQRQGKRITDFQELGGLHANKVYLVRFEDGSGGILKPNFGVDTKGFEAIPMWTVADREVFVSELNQAYQFKRVRTTTIVETEHGRASLQSYVDNLQRADRKLNYVEQEMEELAVIDYVVANPDRNMGNFGGAPRGKLTSELIGIDHGPAGPPPEAGYTIVSPFVKKYLGKELSAETIAKVRALDPREVEAMAKARGLNESEVKAAVNRHKEIQEKGMIVGEGYEVDGYGIPSNAATP